MREQHWFIVHRPSGKPFATRCGEMFDVYIRTVRSMGALVEFVSPREASWVLPR